jgi:hypothetical protein
LGGQDEIQCSFDHSHPRLWMFPLSSRFLSCQNPQKWLWCAIGTAEHGVRDAGAGGSNPLTPTRKINKLPFLVYSVLAAGRTRYTFTSNALAAFDRCPGEYRAYTLSVIRESL